MYRVSLAEDARHVGNHRASWDKCLKRLPAEEFRINMLSTITPTEDGNKFVMNSPKSRTPPPA